MNLTYTVTYKLNINSDIFNKVYKVTLTEFDIDELSDKTGNISIDNIIDCLSDLDNLEFIFDKIIEHDNIVSIDVDKSLFLIEFRKYLKNIL